MIRTLSSNVGKCWDVKQDNITEDVRKSYSCPNGDMFAMRKVFKKSYVFLTKSSDKNLLFFSNKLKLYQLVFNFIEMTVLIETPVRDSPYIIL